MKSFAGSLFSLNMTFIAVDSALVTISLMVTLIFFDSNFTYLKSMMFDEHTFNYPENVSFLFYM